MSISPPEQSSLEPAGSLEAEPLLNCIVGVAVFDRGGLPREYFVTAENDSTSWVQIVFQALGLKSLLMASLKLESFQQIAISLHHQSAFVIRTKTDYIALLLDGTHYFSSVEAAERFNQWVRQFEQQQLRQHPRFFKV